MPTVHATPSGSPGFASDAIIRSGPNPTLDATASAVTLTADQFLSGMYEHDPGGAVSDVLPTAAQVITALQQRGIIPTLGMCGDLWYINRADGAEAITVTAGDDLSLWPTALVIDQNETALLHWSITALEAPYGADADNNIDVLWVLGQAS